MNSESVHVLLNSFRMLVPEAVLVLAACLIFLGGTFQASRKLWAELSLVALAVAQLCLIQYPLPGIPSQTAVHAAPLFLDNLALLVKTIALISGVVLVLSSWNETPDDCAAEFYACLLISVAGLSLSGCANDLVTLFLSLELISIPTYVMLYLPRRDSASQEAATKYFLLSVFSSAFLLFGFSYLYGLSGTTNLPALVSVLKQPGLPILALVALVMVVTGLGFKITAVPFHFYAPDVYQGAPTVVAAVLAFIPKAAGFIALLRVLGFVTAGGDVEQTTAYGAQMPILLWIVAAVTMTLGNVLALLQDNLKRLLAYSSVAHAGYMLIGLAVANRVPSVSDGVMAMLFYLIAYGGMTIGAFAVLAYLSTPERPVETENDLAGLGTSHPEVALLMTVFLLSLIGMPATAGFAGKALLFWSALEAGSSSSLFVWLAVVGAINAAIGAWYYLRILAKMYLQTAVQPLARPQALPILAAIYLCAALTLYLGMKMDPLVNTLRGVRALPPAKAAAAIGMEEPRAER